MRARSTKSLNLSLSWASKSGLGMNQRAAVESGVNQKDKMRSTSVSVLAGVFCAILWMYEVDGDECEDRARPTGCTNSAGQKLPGVPSLSLLFSDSLYSFALMAGTKHARSDDDAVISESSPFLTMFESFRAEFDEHQDRRERIIKASRDITALSKKM